jgi:intracellular sulfur oxidation DsrE/DsrF family protein
MSPSSVSSSERRSFLTRMNKSLASFAAMAGVAMAQQKTPGSSVRFEAARHEKDDWLDQIPGKHRIVFDCPTPEALGDALGFAGNFIRVNKADYGVEASELAVVIIARHRATPFGYTDAMWAKYGRPLAERAHVEDPQSKLAPKINMYNSNSYGEALPNRRSTLESLAKQGVQFGVCGVSTRGYAGVVAEAAGANVDAVFKELSSNLVTNARLVPAGIVAMSRAQERGYTLVCS